VTVLMSVHNGRPFLAEAVESVLHQTFRDYEFLIINDGSTDDSGEIVRSYGDPRIRLVDNPVNIGLTRSLNRGLALARGSWIARQDADDVSDVTRLEKQLAFVEVFPDVVLLGTQARYMDEKGRKVSVRGWEKAQSELGIKWQLMFDSPCVHSSVLFRHDVVWRALGGYDERFTTSQDFELWSRVAASYAVRNLGDCLVSYRLSAGSMSAQYRENAIRIVENVFRANLHRALDSVKTLEEWPRLWIDITNRNTVGTIKNAARAIDLMPIMFSRFAQVHPTAARCAEIRRHMASKLIYVASYLTDHDRGNSLRAFLLACRYDIRVARQLGLRYLARLTLGASARPLRRRFREAAADFASRWRY
jgi:glycosyltransferase involved in cell wall biosynthesis